MQLDCTVGEQRSYRDAQANLHCVSLILISRATSRCSPTAELGVCVPVALWSVKSRKRKAERGGDYHSLCLSRAYDYVSVGVHMKGLGATPVGSSRSRLHSPRRSRGSGTRSRRRR